MVGINMNTAGFLGSRAGKGLLNGDSRVFGNIFPMPSAVIGAAFDPSGVVPSSRLLWNLKKGFVFDAVYRVPVMMLAKDGAVSVSVSMNGVEGEDKVDEVDSMVNKKVGVKTNKVDKKVEKMVEKMINKMIDKKVGKIIEDKVHETVKDMVHEMIDKKLEKIINKKVGKKIDKEIKDMVHEMIDKMIEDKVNMIEKKIEDKVEQKINKKVDDMIVKMIEDKVHEIIKDEVNKKINKVEDKVKKIEKIQDKVDKKLDKMISEVEVKVNKKVDNVEKKFGVWEHSKVSGYRTEVVEHIKAIENIKAVEHIGEDAHIKAIENIEAVEPVGVKHIEVAEHIEAPVEVAEHIAVVEHIESNEHVEVVEHIGMDEHVGVTGHIAVVEHVQAAVALMESVLQSESLGDPPVMKNLEVAVHLMEQVCELASSGDLDLLKPIQVVIDLLESIHKAAGLDPVHVVKPVKVESVCEPASLVPPVKETVKGNAKKHVKEHVKVAVDLMKLVCEAAILGDDDLLVPVPVVLDLMKSVVKPAGSDGVDVVEPVKVESVDESACLDEPHVQAALEPIRKPTSLGKSDVMKHVKVALQKPAQRSAEESAFGKKASGSAESSHVKVMESVKHTTWKADADAKKPSIKHNNKEAAAAKTPAPTSGKLTHRSLAEIDRITGVEPGKRKISLYSFTSWNHGRERYHEDWSDDEHMGQINKYIDENESEISSPPRLQDYETDSECDPKARYAAAGIDISWVGWRGDSPLQNNARPAHRPIAFDIPSEYDSSSRQCSSNWSHRLTELSWDSNIDSPFKPKRVRGGADPLRLEERRPSFVLM
ncbi:uncharacterized protein BO97DRAFT_421945 [Aspergillus homomorphus CBS 101889]|uniref:Uncharacterized protein n=1 Tax=Aspergillus homomorphus (strain CBS 101889) TaxID=1450537 RepID=A0A395I4M6_ASPHC|nr:hypothetical protein BO97DRAFT_421945 [Aspergillus homomorphus CBS 101889]RAL15151.1 hypothetical protein BO97DRAFT_421945 [Aspergillus homomorphus CBS 101889]